MRRPLRAGAKRLGRAAELRPAEHDRQPAQSPFALVLRHLARAGEPHILALRDVRAIRPRALRAAGAFRIHPPRHRVPLLGSGADDHLSGRRRHQRRACVVAPGPDRRRAVAEQFRASPRPHHRAASDPGRHRRRAVDRRCLRQQHQDVLAGYRSGTVQPEQCPAGVGRRQRAAGHPRFLRPRNQNQRAVLRVAHPAGAGTVLMVDRGRTAAPVLRLDVRQLRAIAGRLGDLAARHFRLADRGGACRRRGRNGQWRRRRRLQDRDVRRRRGRGVGQQQRGEHGFPDLRVVRNAGARLQRQCQLAADLRHL